MKPAQIFNQYIWIINTLRAHKRLTFEQRWYLLALNNDEQMRIYALDRVTKVELTDETFEMPADFSSEAYFSDYYGVKTDGTPMAHVVVRAHRWTPDYLRTLPLHHSQCELEFGEITHADSTTSPYTDFSYDIRPTDDFLNELMKFGIEVLRPIDLREKMRHRVLEMYHYYEQK